MARINCTRENWTGARFQCFRCGMAKWSWDRDSPCVLGMEGNNGRLSVLSRIPAQNTQDRIGCDIWTCLGCIDEIGNPS